jgi:glutamate-1-semialdehyde 2,1-aminomutase
MDIDEAIDEATARFISKRPKTAALHDRAARVMPGGNTRTVLYTAPFPIRALKAEGAEISDIDGHSYIDLLGEYSQAFMAIRIRESKPQ